jgi:hypothetical protein
MKNYFLCIIVLVLVTFLCIGLSSAVNPRNVAVPIFANEPVQIQSPFIASEKDQLTLKDIKATLPPEVIQSINDQITFNESVTKAIAQKEGQLTKSPLTIKDSYDLTGKVQGFFVSNFSTLLEPASEDPEQTQTNITPSVILLPENQIPTGGFIEYGSDGKTRVFTSEGIQIAYTVDDRSEKVTTPSGKLLPSTHILAIPSGAASHTRGNREYITLNGVVILTIVDQYSKDATRLSTVPSPRSFSWVEYAESDPYYIADIHSNWIIPYSPTLFVPANNANILFNGIEPSDGSMIFQPVTAFNYYEHSLTKNRNDPVILNRWTGSSWVCPPDTSHCHHSDPVLSFSQGELAYGAVFWYEAPVSEWFVYLVNSSNQGTWQFSDPYIYLQPTRAVITYEYGGSLLSGDSPLDSSQKIYSTTFSNISVWDTGNQITNLHWKGFVNFNDHKRTTGLNVDLTRAPSIVTLNTSDYRTITGVYRPGSGFYLKKDNGNYWNPSTDLILTWDNAANDRPIAGDWNRNGKDKTGVYRPGSGFYLKMDNGNTWNPTTDLILTWDNAANDQPIAGDWNGDGRDETGVYRPGSGFYLKMDNGNTWNPSTDRYLAWDNAANDRPIAGDWNGDGRDETGVYRPGSGFYLKMDNGNTWNPSTDLILLWDQAANDRPIAGDWNGDGRDETGVYRPGNGFYLKMDNGNTWNTISDHYLFWDNMNGDLPIAGSFV